MSELVHIPEEIVVNPISGEAKALAELTPDEIRDGIEQLSELSALVREALAKLSAEAWHRKNSGNKVSGVDVTQSRTWHVGNTASALDRLIADGKVSEDCRKFIYPTEAHKADSRSLNALADSLVAKGDLESAQLLLSARRDSVRARVKS